MRTKYDDWLDDFLDAIVSEIDYDLYTWEYNTETSEEPELVPERRRAMKALITKHLTLKPN